MHGLPRHATGTQLFIVSLKIWIVSESFISLGKIFHIFGAKYIHLVPCVTDLTLLSKSYFHEVHNYIDMAQTLHLKVVVKLPASLSKFLLPKLLSFYGVLLQIYL